MGGVSYIIIKEGENKLKGSYLRLEGVGGNNEALAGSGLYSYL